MASKVITSVRAKILTHAAKSAQDLADQAMTQTDPAERAKIIEELFDVLESEQTAEAWLDSAA